MSISNFSRVLSLTVIGALASACSAPIGAIPSTSEESRTATAVATGDATIQNSVTETTTETATETATVTATETILSTVTVTAVSTISVSSVATVTQTVVQTVTETVTHTDVEPEIAYGKYSSDTCYLNALASEGMGQKIYTRSSIRFSKNGLGKNYFELFEDSECLRSAYQGKMNISYTVTRKNSNVLLITMDQYNEPTADQTLVRYWIVGIQTKDGLRLDIDAARGARGPYLEEPKEEELKYIEDGIEKRGVLFLRKKNS